MAKNYKFKSVFSCRISKIGGSELDKYVSLASLDKLKSLMPNIDLEANPDLIGAVLNAAVGNLSNLNGDCLDNKTLVEIGKNFIYKRVDANHVPTDILGVICNNGYSEFGSDKLLTEEEAIKSEKPINLSLAILLYDSVLSDDFKKLLSESIDENSKKFNQISASWELFFDEYDIAIGETRNLKDCNIYSGDQTKEFEKYLMANGGTGKVDNKFVFRVIKKELLVPAGIGLTENPAAAVKGIYIINKDKPKQTKASKFSQILDKFQFEIEKLQEIESKLEDFSTKTDIFALATSNDSVTSIFTLLDIIQKNIDGLSNSTKNSVNTNNDNMKFTSINDLNDENLKECKASVIKEVWETGIKEANEKWKIEVDKEKAQSAKIVAQNEELQKTITEQKEKLDNVAKELKDIKEATEASKRQEQFDTRMSGFDSQYELDDALRGIIAKRIKDLDDTQFKDMASELDILLAAKKKMLPKKDSGKNTDDSKDDTDDDGDCADAKKDKKKSKASDNSKEVVDDALKNANPVNTQVPNTSSNEDDFKARWANAFSIENCFETKKK